MKQNRNKRELGRQTARTIFWRTMILMVVFGVAIFVPLGFKLYDLQITQHDWLQERATDQQTRDVTVSATRGGIFDTSGNTLAVSATVYNIILSPKDINTVTDAQINALYDDDLEDDVNYSDGLSESQKEAVTQQIVEDRIQLIAENMHAILGVEISDIEERCTKTQSQYSLIARKVETEAETQVREFIEENDLSACIYLTPTTKRYYPYSTLASQVIGFVNADDEGTIGLESQYQEILSGTTGRIVTAKNNRGTDLYYYYSDYYDAEDGSNLYLTIDSTIQYYCEQTLQEGIDAYQVENGGWCIAMDPNTGAILGMASAPNYDPNDPSSIIDAVELAELEAYQQELAANTELTAEEAEELYTEAVGASRWEQWTNKCVNATYEPGSTFKSCVLAAALEEGAVDENATFYCTGSVEVDGWNIRCSNRSGHGTQTLAAAVGNSCNPAFISIGASLGIDKFWEYLTAFGFTEKTGVDLAGEEKGVLRDQESFTTTDLAAESFGQRFTVTPMQLITAFSASINGGYLYTPHVLKYITDSDGNVTTYQDTNLVRQVVSENTSAQVREMLEGVVSTYTGKNAYQAGYRIGGKTGTSQTLVEDRYVVSFVGFAPADDPQVIVLLAFDGPKIDVPNSDSSTGACGVYISGGNMAAPLAGELIAEICDYMGVVKQYTADEQATADTTVPSVIGMTETEAVDTLENQNLTYRIEGEGDTVTSQVPAAGITMAGGSEVVLYFGETEVETVEMPDLTGLTQQEAESTLRDVGLNMNASGITTTSDSVADNQSIRAGVQVEVGSVITVHFSTAGDDGELATLA